MTSRRLTFLALLAAWLALPALAGTFSVSWDAVPDASVTGYRVFWGTATGSYPNQVDVPKTTNTVLQGIPDSLEVFIAVKARTSDGTVSQAFSNEIRGWATPTVAPVPPPTSYPRGASASLTLTGTNFRPGMGCVLLGEIGADTISCTLIVNSPTSVIASWTVPATTGLGARELKLTNQPPDNGYVALRGVVNIVAATPAPAPPPPTNVKRGSPPPTS